MLTVKKEPYKYRIYQLLISTYGSNAPAARKELNKLVPMRTVNNDITIRLTETAQIPDSRLAKYANALGTTIDFLKEDYINFLSNNQNQKAA